jgi:hypothetical protein
MTIWRWDQGRLKYFSYDSIRSIAKSLSGCNGIDLDGDPLKPILCRETGLPFLPDTYKVWRNYARVFQCMGLASRIGTKLTITDLCQMISGKKGPELGCDDYFSFIIPRSYQPSPWFQNYSTQTEKIFPFCAVLKLLLSKQLMGRLAKIDINEIFSLLIGNEVTGKESITYYNRIKVTGLKPRDDEGRQLREMLIFLSQFTCLHWEHPNLYLTTNAESTSILESIVNPVEKTSKPNKDEEVLNIFSQTTTATSGLIYGSITDPFDGEFTEGKRIRSTHLRIERNSRLHKTYLNHLGDRIQCDTCSLKPRQRYPDASGIIEIHHLLPLGSSISVSTRGVTFNDLAPLCANCHRAVHSYYKNWLNLKGQEDFLSSKDSLAAYNAAKKKINDNLK